MILIAEVTKIESCDQRVSMETIKFIYIIDCNLVVIIIVSDDVFFFQNDFFFIESFKNPSMCYPTCLLVY